MTTEQLPKAVGSAAEIRGELRRVRSDTLLLEHKWEGLLKQHEDQWVAAYRGELIFARSLPQLLSAAKRRQWPLGGIVVDHLKRERRALLLNLGDPRLL